MEYLSELRKNVVPNMAICDIDGGVTNEIDLNFPEVHMEPFLVKNLNILKNQQMQQFDQAFDHSFNPDEDEKKFVKDVRSLFFNILKPILSPLIVNDEETGKPKYFHQVDSRDVSAVFEKYFKKAEYFELFEGSASEEFVARLMEAGAF